MNRHEEACNMIWEVLERAKENLPPSLAKYFPEPLVSIERILTLTESRIQDDLEEQHKAYLADQNKGPDPIAFI